MAIEDDFFLTNLELRDSTETGDVASGLSHDSMKGMVLLTVLELAARGEPTGAVTVIHGRALSDPRLGSRRARLGCCATGPPRAWPNGGAPRALQRTA
jgi:hypothetical protein